MKQLVIYLLFILTISASGQKSDSLWNVWMNEKEPDTVRVGALINLYNPIMYKYPDSAMRYVRMHVNYGKKIKSFYIMAGGENGLGQIHWLKGNADSAAFWYNESIIHFRKAGKKNGEAGSMINLGILYANKGEIEKAIEYYEKGIELCEEIGELSFKLNALNNMGVIYLDRGNYDKAIEIFKEVVDLSSVELRGSDAHKGGLVNLGYSYAKKGKHREAIECYHKCLKLIDEGGNGQVITYAYNFLAGSYLDLGETENALKYFQLSFDIAEERGDKFAMASPLSNMADIYLAQDGNSKRAREAYEKARKLMIESGYISAALQPLYSIASIDLDEGKIDSAESKFSRGIEESRKMGELDQEACMLYGMGCVMNAKMKYSQALNYLNKSYDIAKEIGDLQILIMVTEQLSICYEELGQNQSALHKYREFIHYRDSLERDENKRAAIREEYRYSYEKQAIADSLEQREKDRITELAYQEEIRKKEKSRNALIVLGVFVILIAVGLYSRLRFVRKSKSIIEKEKERSENLLLNILPAEVAEELKEKGKADARDFEMVSILFTDFKGFTEQSARLSAANLVNEINHCFEAFDGIMEKFSIEKIKTIGDAYMAAGGLPIPTDDSVKNTVLAALEMQTFISKRKTQNDTAGKLAFEMRVGIHTGPVVAGIVGVKKFQYDIWGDTVNTASRMESNGVVGKVNISQSTYELLKYNHQFSFESRGKVEVKGKGEMEMYFVSKA